MRQLMRWGAVAGLWLGLASGAVAQTAAGLPSAYRVADRPALALSVEALSSETEVEIDGRHVQMQAAPDARSMGYKSLMASEFSRYPAALLQVVGLQRVVVCGQLTVEGQVHLGAFDCEGGTLYFTAQDLRRNLHYARVVLHHEFYHFLAQKVSGDIYTDPRWAALNRADFSYGDGGSSMQSDYGCAELSTGTPGFLTRYATAGLEEDKAETFAHLMIDAPFVMARAKADAVLGGKVRLLAREFGAYGGAAVWR